MKRKPLFAVVAAVVVAGAGVGIGLAVTSGPTVHPVKVVTGPPATINTTCSTDDTEALGTWLLSVPNGTPGHDNIAKLKKGACYEINGSIWDRGAHNIILDGNAATIRQENVATTGDKWVTVGGKDNPAVAPYCGRPTALMNDSYTAITTNVLLLSFEGGCDITIENLTILGQHNTVGTTGAFQPDTFVNFYGTQRALVKDVKFVGPYGDYVDGNNIHEVNGGYPATDITVEDSKFENSGRSGIAVTNGTYRLTVEDDTFTVTSDKVLSASVFDDETDVIYPAPIDTDLLYQHNKFIGEGYAYLLVAITGTEMQRIAFLDNTLTAGAQMRIDLDPHDFGGTVNNNVEIEGNTSTASTTWPNNWSPVNVHNVTDVLVEGNTDAPPSYAGTGHPFASFYGKGVTLACGDKTPTGTALDAACPTPLPVITPPVLPTLPS